MALNLEQKKAVVAEVNEVAASASPLLRLSIVDSPWKS